MAVSFHCGLFETASTTRPRARSLSAIMARGRGILGVNALGVVARQAQDRQVGNRVTAAEFLIFANENISAILVALEAGPVVDFAVDVRS